MGEPIMKLARTGDTDATALMRSAAHELLPVIVEMGPEQARFGSFVGAVQDEGGGYAVLEPIAEALPAVADQPFRIVSAAGDEWYVVAHRLEREGPQRVRVELARARVFSAEPSSASVAVPASEVLVLVVPGGLHGSSAYVFPIQRIGADVCEIRSSVALEPGRDLPCVEVVGDRRLLRRASAQVLESVPFYQPDGSQTFSCRLSLNDQVGVEAQGGHDLVTDPAEVKRLLGFAGMMRAEGWYEAPGRGRGLLRFVEVGKSDASFELPSQRAAEKLDRQGSIRIGVELFAVPYELDVRILQSRGTQLVTSLPLILRRRRRHRRDQRVQVTPPHEVELSFRNPITGAAQTHAVAEVSFFGVSFDCPAIGAVLWQGLPLEQAQLAWDDRLVHVGDLTVEQYGYDQVAGRVRCTASITQSRIADDHDMICLMATLAHPEVRTHDGTDFSALHRTYLKAGLFGPHMERNLEPILEQTREMWKTLHTGAQDMVRTFVHGPEQAPDAAVTIMRAWEHGWVLQHFVDTSPELAGATGKLQHAYLDHLVPRPDGRYLMFFVKTDNRIMNAYLRRFFASTGTPEAVTRSTVELWSRPADASRGDTSTDAVEVRKGVKDDEVVIARAAQRCLGSAGAGALSMIPGELELPDTSGRFAAAGLERRRDYSVVTRNGESLYALLEERATPGMNLTWMLNATWVLPVHPERDPDGSALDAALAEVVDRPAQTATGERFLNLPEGIDPQRLAAWGFTKEASLYFYVLTRAGLHRFYHYAASRYGELDALASRRERRRAERGGDDEADSEG
jgi:hypothetical protein